MHQSMSAANSSTVNTASDAKYRPPMSGSHTQSFISGPGDVQDFGGASAGDLRFLVVGLAGGEERPLVGESSDGR